MTETPAPPGAEITAEPAAEHPPDGGAVAKTDEAPVYTCPMHPEVVSPKPGVCPKCGMRLVLKTTPPKQAKPKKHEYGVGGSR